MFSNAASRKGPKKGTIQCNGDYEPQQNPVNGKQSQCALSGKNIHYWDNDFIPRVFTYDAKSNYKPCPFKGPDFQWMRNLVLCSKIARDNNLKAAFVVIYAASPVLPFSEIPKKSRLA
jgi:hypothetical protein